MRHVIFLGLMAGCHSETVDDSDSNPPSTDKTTTSDSGADTEGEPAVTTDEQLAEFYAQHGGREAFPGTAVSALETLLYAQDELEAGQWDAARARLDSLFEELPLYDDRWTTGEFFDGANIGHPVAYYGLRMLDQVLKLGPQESSDTLQMTAVLAPCAEVRRPTLPDLEPETVQLELAPEITEERLSMVTALFRAWVESISGGLKVDLVVHTLSECTTVDYTDDGSVIVSYPDATGMVGAVPDDISDATHFWWVVAPSGVPGDGSGYGRHFITGGMGGVGPLPLFLSDDGWFTRKPEHMGSGAYTEAELRAYQPQWFQHEFMHHLYRTWPEYGLEDKGHQWFDRTTWPEDFEGRWEPDYYYESIEKRLLSAEPSIADALSIELNTDPSVLNAAALEGDYEHAPVQNNWHIVSVGGSDANLVWSNAAGASWPLVFREEGLWTTDACPYGEQELGVESKEGVVQALWFLGGRYVRQGAESSGSR